MRARDEPFAGHVPPCALVGARNAGVGERLGDPLRTRIASAANGGEPVVEHAIGGIDLQRDDVDRVRFPAHGEFGAGNERDCGLAGGRRRFGQAAGVVVVGER